jgi:hypothetical protein
MSIQSEGIRSLLARRQAMLGRNAAPAASQNDPGQRPQAGSYNDFAAGSDYMSGRDYEEAETSSLQKSMSDRTAASQSERRARMIGDAQQMQGQPVLKPQAPPEPRRDPSVAPPMRLPEPAVRGRSLGPVGSEETSSEVDRDPVFGAATADARRRKDRAAEQRKKYGEGDRPLPRVDPEVARQQAADATGRYKPDALGASPEQKAANRATGGKAGAATAGAGAARDAATQSADAAQYQRDMDKHDATRLHLESQLNTAYDTGFGVEEAAAALDAHNSAMPKPPATITGGKTPQEMTEEVADTLRRLHPDHQRELESRFPADEDGVYRDLEVMYADLDPDERHEVMTNDAKRVTGSTPSSANYKPTFKTGATPATVAPAPGKSDGTGYGSKFGDSADPELKTPEQKRMSGHDYSNGAPMRENRGTFVQNPNGSYSSRAVHPDHLDTKLDPNGEMVGNRYVMTPEWREQMKWAGHQVGLDASKFEGGDQSDAWIAATQDKLRHHQKMVASGMQSMPVATGGYRYAPSQAMKDKQEHRQLQADARAFIKQYPPRLDANGKPLPDDKASQLQAAANAGDRETYNALKQEMRQERNMQTSAAARTQLLQRGETQNWQSPTRAPGMLRDSLRQAGTDPRAQASAYRIAGVTSPALNAQAAHLENAATVGDAADAQAAADALKNENDSKPPAQLTAENEKFALDQALDDTLTPEQARAGLITARQQNKGPEMSDDMAAVEIARHVMKKSGGRVDSPHVQHALTALLQKPSRFAAAGAEGDNTRDGHTLPPGLGYTEEEFVRDAAKLYGPAGEQEYRQFYKANAAQANRGK